MRWTAGLAAAGTMAGLGIGQAEEAPLPAPYGAMDANEDGRVSEDEYVAYAVTRARAAFQNLDADGDRVLQASETAPTSQRESGAGKVPDLSFGLLPRVSFGDGARKAEARKRLSAGPSMRQSGR